RESALLEELGREARVRSEEQVAVAVDDARVQVGHGHGRGTGRRLAVHLRVVALDELRGRGAQEDAGHWEAAVAAALRAPRRLEELQPTAAGADEDELRVDLERLARAVIADGDRPAVRGPIQVRHGVGGPDLNTAILDVAQQLAGERAEVHVGAAFDARDAVDLPGTALLEHE